MPDVPSQPPDKPSGSLNLPWLVFTAVAVSVVLSCFIYPNLWDLFIAPLHFSEPDSPLYPFLDMNGRLSAVEAHHLGLDIRSHPNYLDPQLRYNTKPTWFFFVGHFGVDKDWLVPAGLVLVILFLLCNCMLIRPTTFTHAGIGCLVLLSPGVMLGIERANDDLIFFLFLSTIPLLLSRAPPWLGQWLSWLLIFMTAPAKFYPGAAFLVLLREKMSSARLLLMLIAGGLFLAAVLITRWEEYSFVLQYSAEPTGVFAHGGELLLPASIPAWIPQILTAVIFGGTFAAGLRKPGAAPAIPDGLPRHFLLLGTAVLVFCFTLNTNYDYRYIYTLMTLPALFALHRYFTARNRPRILGLVFLILIGMLWIDWLMMRIDTNSFQKPLSRDSIPLHVATTLKNWLTMAYIGFCCYWAGVLLAAVDAPFSKWLIRRNLIPHSTVDSRV